MVVDLDATSTDPSPMTPNGLLKVLLKVYYKNKKMCVPRLLKKNDSNG